MRLHTHEWGDPAGPPVVCLHGLTGDGGRFRRLAQALPGRRVVAFDLRGHGRSGGKPPWDAGTHVADVVETLDLERADWIGFSYGGLIASLVAASTPGLVSRLCLLDPAIAVPPDLCLQKALEELEEESYGSVAEAVEAELSSDVLFRAPRGLLEEFVPETLVERADGRFVPVHSRPMAVTAWSEMARTAPPAAEVLTLLLTAERSWIPVDAGRYRAALGELLTEEVVPGGHSVLWDALDETAAAVASFLSGGRS